MMFPHFLPLKATSPSSLLSETVVLLLSSVFGLGEKEEKLHFRFGEKAKQNYCGSGKKNNKKNCLCLAVMAVSFVPPAAFARRFDQCAAQRLGYLLI